MRVTETIREERRDQGRHEWKWRVGGEFIRPTDYGEKQYST